MRARRLISILALLVCPLSAATARAAPSTGPRLLGADELDRSLELGRQFLLNCQRPDGSFIFELDAVRGVDRGTRHAAREMNGLWALALFHRRDPAPQTAVAIAKALKLQDTYAKRTGSGGRYVHEPDAREWLTSTMATYLLALQDFLAAEGEIDPEFRDKCQRDLADGVKFLLSLRLRGGRFSSLYRCSDGVGTSTPTPSADGEALLVLVRAAKDDPTNVTLRDAALESAAVMYGEYVRAALRGDPHSELTRAFYRPGSLAFYELYTSEWPGTQPYAARTITMAQWMIGVQDVVNWNGNPSSAFQGLAVAWALARLTNDVKNQQHIGTAIDRGLARLMTWQVGSPLASSRLLLEPPSPKARGGVLAAAQNPHLFIDTTADQMHATMLARWLLFRPDEAADGR
jgi:hypothetical protein